MTQATENSLTIPVEGMTCAHCVGTVRQALESVPGVKSAEVDLARKRAEVAVDSAGFDRSKLTQAIEAAGYRVPGESSSPPINLVTIGPIRPTIPAPKPAEPEEWNLAIGGMHCASCVSRVEGALSGVPGVESARVNLATERAGVRVDPSRVTEAQLAEAVAKAGYTARRAELVVGEGAESLRRERAEQLAYWRNRLIVGVVFTIPLVVLGYAPLLSSTAAGHSSAIGWTMFGLASVLQVYLGGPYFRGAWERLKQKSSNMDTLIALGTSTAFGYSLVAIAARPLRTTPTRSWTPGSS